MIYVNNAWNNPDAVRHYGMYHPYKVQGQHNPNFDDYSRLILDLKDGKENGLKHFHSILEPQLLNDISIVIVPSSDSQKIDSGIRKLAQRLIKNGRIDATSCLVRHTTIQKLAHGGDRRKEVHYRSIRVENVHLVQNRNVLLLDDVTTSNNSLLACKELLIQYGRARLVKCVALGKTEGY